MKALRSRRHPHLHPRLVALLLVTFLCTTFLSIPFVAGADPNSTTTQEPSTNNTSIASMEVVNENPSASASTSEDTEDDEDPSSMTSGAENGTEDEPPNVSGAPTSPSRDDDEGKHDEDPGSKGGGSGSCSSSPLRRLSKPPDGQGEEKTTMPKLRINSFYGGLRDFFYVANTGKDVIFQFNEAKPDSEMKILVDGHSHEYVLGLGRLLFGQNDDDSQDGEGDDEEDEEAGDPEAPEEDPSSLTTEGPDDPSEGGGDGDKHVGESGSQHAINGERYAAELQLIHYQQGTGSLEKAAEVDGGILVVCVLLEVSMVPNPSLAPIISGFSFLVPTPKRKKGTGGFHYKEIHGPLEVKSLFPPPVGNSLRYYEYSAWFGMEGWISNPCGGVSSKWLVIDETSYLGLDQMADLSNVLTSGGVPMGEEFSQMGGGDSGSSGEEVNQFKHSEAVLVWEEDQDDLTSSTGVLGAPGAHFQLGVIVMWGLLIVWLNL